MIYNSPSPFEVGLFNPDEANIVAREIANGDFQISRTGSSGRLVVDSEMDALGLLDRIDFCNAVDDIDGVIRNRVYAQDFAEIERRSFTGLPWHIDIHGDITGDGDSFDFNFGSSTHPTEYVVGRLDLTKAHKLTSDVLDRDATPAQVVFWARDLVASAIETAKNRGDLTTETMEEGILYRVQKGTIHRMQPYDSDLLYPPRFVVEQYFKPVD